MKTPVKLLIIDDNKSIVDVLYIFFSNMDYNVSTATNGLEALKIIEKDKFRFDLIITDLVMPSVSGTAIITIVKKKYPKIPVIAMTGCGEYPKTMASEAHADAIMEKPFDLPEMENLVKKLLTEKKKT